VVWYPVALEAFLIAKIDVMDVERETFGTLQGASGFFTASAFAGGNRFFRGFSLGFSYRRHPVSTAAY